MQAPFAAPSSDKRQRLQQLRTVKVAYEQLTPKEPQLPDPESLLPAVLALKTTQQAIQSSKDAISNTRQHLSSTEADLNRENDELHDNKLITASLDRRIGQLREQKIAEPAKSASDVASKLVVSKQGRKLNFERETQRLHDALMEFIEEHLAIMVAAEELGGPVVGDVLDLDERALVHGFAKGRPSKSARTSDSRQRRIDEIWGATSHRNRARPQSEKEAAAHELHVLIEKLIAALVGTSASGVYVELERDSAAARFLVRAKLAQFHPKDARRLRLVDFGRELDE